MIAQKLRAGALDAVVLNGWAMLVGGLLLLAAVGRHRGLGDFVWSAESVGSIAYLALFGSAIAFVTLTVLLRHISAMAVAFLAMLLPFGALIFGRCCTTRASRPARGGRGGAGGGGAGDSPVVAPVAGGAGAAAGVSAVLQLLALRGGPAAPGRMGGGIRSFSAPIPTTVGLSSICLTFNAIRFTFAQMDWLVVK